MALKLNLEKSKSSLKLSLEKSGVLIMPVLDMALVLDVSGSFEDEHADGVTTDLMTRLAPWGLTFDPDHKLDVLTFSNGAASAHKVGELTEHNYENYVRKHIVGKVPGWNGATDYSYVLELALRSFGWIADTRKVGFLGRMLGMKDEAPTTRRRSLVLFITDGDNNDKERTMQVLRASEQRRDEVYFLFLGVANGPGRFEFLESIGDAFGNTGYREIKNVRAFVNKSDEEINAFLLDDELVNWLKQPVA